MYLLYVDESGDPGVGPGPSGQGSPTEDLLLAGLIVHESKWTETHEALLPFRMWAREEYGIPLRYEFHARAWLHAPGEYARISLHERVEILRELINVQATRLPWIRLIHAWAPKSQYATHHDVFDRTWERTLVRVHRTLDAKGFPAAETDNERVIVLYDGESATRLHPLIRTLRRENWCPRMGGTGRENYRLTRIIEDALPKDSAHSYLVQLCDVNAYFLRQWITPNSIARRYHAKDFFPLLKPAICMAVSPYDPHKLGIIHATK